MDGLISHFSHLLTRRGTRSFTHNHNIFRLCGVILFLTFTASAFAQSMTAMSVEQFPPAPPAPPPPATQPTESAVLPTPSKISLTEIPAPAATQSAPVAASRPSIENSPIRGHQLASTPANSNTKSTTPVGTSMMDSFYSVLQVIVALAVVIGLILLGKTFARKFIPGAAASSGKNLIEILARHPIAKGQSLLLVRIGSQIVVLAQNKESSQSILVINEPTEIANILGQVQGTKKTSIQTGFTKLLANAQMDLEKGEGLEEEFTAPRLSTKANEPSEAELDAELDDMAAAKRQLLELRAQVRSVRDNLSRS